MAVFFDIDNLNDLNLLHKSVREDYEIQNVVDQVEWEIIDSFKQRDMESLTTYESFFRYENGQDPRDDIRVRLVGYDEETPVDSEEGLKEALRRTIADIVSWVLSNYDKPNNVTSRRSGNRSISYAGTVPTWRDFPHGWDKRLHNYNAKIAGYGI